MATKNLLVIENEANRCLLCHDPMCNRACHHNVTPAAVMRSLRFKNLSGAKKRAMSGSITCSECNDKMCQKVCARARIDSHINISKVIEALIESDIKAAPDKNNISLATEFCGVKCENPFFLASSPVANSYQMCARALKMGWAGIVYKTIATSPSQEVSPRFDVVSKEGTSVIGFKNMEQLSEHSYEENLDTIARLKKEFPTKVIVVSIMGKDSREWEFLAKKAQEAGADMIECNFSCPQMTIKGMGSDVGQNPDLIKEYVSAVKKATTLPVLAKMTPNLADMTIPAIAAMESGATGIAAINTIKCITAIDTNSLSCKPVIAGASSVSGYSGKAVKPIALRFIYSLKTCDALKQAPISGIGGIENWQDALDFILLGASNLQISTAVMQYGYRIIDDLCDGLSNFMAEHNYNSIDQLVGLATNRIIAPELLNRKTIQYPVMNYDNCIGCGRCHISCLDGGHSAIEWSNRRKPQFNKENCVGCLLCSLVCPVGAITCGDRVAKQ